MFRLKKGQLRGLPSVVLFLKRPTCLNRSTVYVHTNVHAVSVSVIHRNPHGLQVL